MAGTTRTSVGRANPLAGFGRPSPKYRVAPPTPVLTMDMGSVYKWFAFMRIFGIATGRAIPEFLNQAAFDGRRASEKAIRASMTVRVASLLPFFSITKAKKGSSKTAVFVSKISTMAVKSPGAPRTRFTGWGEQEIGTGDRRERSHTLAARNDSWTKKIYGPNRVKPENQFLSIEKSKFKNAPYTQRVAKFLTDLRYKRYRKPFILVANSGNKKPIKHGLYKFKGRQPNNKREGKITMLINFERRPKQPRRRSIFMKPIQDMINPAYIGRTFTKVWISELSRRGISRRSVRVR